MRRPLRLMFITFPRPTKKATVPMTPSHTATTKACVANTKRAAHGDPVLDSRIKIRESRANVAVRSTAGSSSAPISGSAGI